MASGLSFQLSIAKGEFDEAMAAIYKPIAQAGTAALREAADVGKKKGRANIGAAGFSKRWQDALRADVYPKKGESASAALLFYHAVPYANVFEEGATIRGKPKLWVPLSSTPTKVNRERITPERFIRGYGPLFPMKIRGKPFLGARIGLTKAAAAAGPPYKVTPRRLRSGASGAAKVVRTVPVFVGIDTVSIRKRFELRAVFREAADSLPTLYLKNLKVD